MSKAIEPVTTQPEPDDRGLESNLPWLHQQVQSCGRPTYFCNRDGNWSAKLDVPTHRPGCTAEVHSGYSHATLSAAMEALLEKLR